MLRKFAAGLSAAVVAAGLAATPAVASALPGSPADPCSDVASAEQTTLDCMPVAPTVAEMSSAKRKSSSPPQTGTPIPEEPTSPPPDVPSSPPPGDSGSGPGPGDSVPPPAAPPVESAGPPAAEATPVTSPPELTAPTRGPAESGKPSKTVLPTKEPLPQTAAESRLLTVAGGGSLVAAGLAWIGGARRRKRPAGPAGD